MTKTQYRDALAKLQLTQQGAADVLGIKLRTSQNYALGATPIPEPVARLLRLIIRLDLEPEDIH